MSPRWRSWCSTRPTRCSISGFREDLEFMLEAMPAEKRSLLFSATVPKGIAMLARSYQRDALRIEVERGKQGHADIEYRAIRIYPAGERGGGRQSAAPRRIADRHRVLQHPRGGAASQRDADRARLFRRHAVGRTQPARAQSGHAGACATGARACWSRPTSPRAASICPMSASSSTPICRTTSRRCSIAAGAPAAPAGRASARS